MPVLAVTDDTLVSKCRRFLSATYRKAQLHEGEWKYSKPLQALSIQVRTMRLLAEMKGMLINKPSAPDVQIKTILINQAYRPQRRTITIPQILGVTPPITALNDPERFDSDAPRRRFKMLEVKNATSGYHESSGDALDSTIRH